MKKGFTLIELLIVISIIGILAVALLPNVLNAPVRGRDAARKADIATITKAIETYNVDNTGGYPAGPICFNGAPTANANLNKLFSGGVPPKDPSGLGPQATLCASGYLYCKLNSGFNYAIYTKLEQAGNNVAAASVPSTCTGAVGTDIYATGSAPFTVYGVAQ